LKEEDMSTPELPPPAGRIEKPGNLGEIRSRLVLVDAFTADQMREMYRAGRLAGLEEAGSHQERMGVLASFAHEVALGAYSEEELLDAAMRALRRVGLQNLDDARAFAIRSLKEKQG
jgi:hypothetical protein